MNAAQHTPKEAYLLVVLQCLLARAEKELADADDCSEVLRARAAVAKATGGQS